MNLFIKQTSSLRAIDEDWLNLYQDYYFFDNRVVKVLDYKDNKLYLEKIDGFALNDFESYDKLDWKEKKFILSEIVDIYWNYLHFKSHRLRKNEFFCHTDFYLRNLIYSNKKLRLIDPDSFMVCNYTTTTLQNSNSGKFMQSFNILQLLMSKDKK